MPDSGVEFLARSVGRGRSGNMVNGFFLVLFCYSVFGNFSKIIVMKILILKNWFEKNTVILHCLFIKIKKQKMRFTAK